MQTRNVSQLKAHPRNYAIYGDHADTDLVESIRTNGVINPLLITEDNIIINGHRRHDAARKAGLTVVPVVVFGSTDEWDILEALVESNRQRQKDNEQLAREGIVLKEIEKERALIRMSVYAREYDNQGVPPVAHPEKGKSIQKVADQLGVGRTTLQSSMKVVEAIDNLESKGKTHEAKVLRTTLNKSVKKAYKTARDEGYIPQAQAKPTVEPTKPKDSKPAWHYVTLSQWRTMSSSEQTDCLARREKKSSFVQQKNNNIEWAKWSWNPVTGCKHNCPYCYARDIANRFYEQGFEPSFLPDRLSAPYTMNVPSQAHDDIGYKNVFTCSMADLFGRWVPSVWIEAVLKTVSDNPQWNFLFLTKFPIRMAEFAFPDNAWVGTTVDCQIRVKAAEDAFSKIDAKVKWLSCEPLLEPLKFNSLDMFSWVVIGGSSESSETPAWIPPREWVARLQVQAWDAGCMVYEKSNLLPMTRIKQYPTMKIEETQLPMDLQYLPNIGAS